MFQIMYEKFDKLFQKFIFGRVTSPHSMQNNTTVCCYVISGTVVRIIKWSTSTYLNGVILTTLGDTVVVGILLHLAHVHLIWENTSSQATVLYGNVAHFWC